MAIQVDAYTRLAEKVRYGDSLEFRAILEVLMTPAQAELAAGLPQASSDLASRLGRSESEIDAMISDMYNRRIIFPTSKGYFFARDEMQLHDATQNDPRYDDFYGGRLFKAWNAFYEAKRYRSLAEEASRARRPGSRVVPHWAAIKGKQDVLPSESMPEILNRAWAIAVMPCPCRRQVQACDRELMACIQLNRSARYAIDRGIARELNYSQALGACRFSREAGRAGAWDDHRCSHTVRKAGEGVAERSGTLPGASGSREGGGCEAQPGGVRPGCGLPAGD